MPEISEHLSIRAACHSDYAIKHGIDNTPDQDAIDHMRLLAANIYEPLCQRLGKIITINSFFRSKALNAAIGGSKISQHCLGMAIDLDCLTGNKAIFNCIRDHFDFDQLIAEFPDREGDPAWVHVSYRPAGNRKMVMRSDKIKGRTIYTNVKILT